jgi:ElaB/YqjD/DUF883 family membrane-anchored ribosome-binding protein
MTEQTANEENSTNNLAADLAKLDDVIKKNPKESVALAFAAGALLALLFRKK